MVETFSGSSVGTVAAGFAVTFALFLLSQSNAVAAAATAADDNDVFDFVVDFCFAFPAGGGNGRNADDADDVDFVDLIVLFELG